MRKSLLLSVILFTVFFTYTIVAQENLNKSKPILEKGKITIKVKEGTGPFQKQEGSVSFGINSLDQKSAKYEVNKLAERFLHKPIPKNSGLPDLSRIYEIEFPIKYNVVKVANDFSLDPNIEYAEPIPINYLLEVPNDTLYSQQWYLHKIQSEQAWDIHKGEDGDSVIVLSITDTGCKYDHPDIGNNIWNNLGEDFDGDGNTFEWNGSAWVFDSGDLNGLDDDANGFIDDLIGWNFDENNLYPTDGNGHGTAVSGLAGATTDNGLGVASISYNLKIMPVRAFNPSGTGTNTNAYNSLIYAAENGADIINCSWGGWPYSNANKEAIEYVSSLGSIIVAAAGNDDSSEPSYPACYPHVIGVAAVDSQSVKTPYSTFGAGVDVSAPGPQNIHPFIALNIIGTYGNVGSGTSFSSPLVTGLLGLIKSYHPTWTVDQLLQQLLYTTTDINAINPGYEHLLGTGKIDAYHALADINPTITPELKLDMTLLASAVQSHKEVLYPNTIMSVSLKVQNYSHFLDANPLTITMTATNPDIQIIDGEFTGIISANSYTDLIDEFQFQVAPNANTAISTLSFTASSNLPIVVGDVFEINVIVNPNGTLVWEGEENGQDYSGQYIKNYMTSNYYPTIYTTESVISYVGMDAVFLSFGNYGSGSGTNTIFDVNHAARVQDYLESGGKLYLEGGDALGFDQASNTELLSLFGIASAADGSTNIINALEGQTGAITEGMLFSSSTQVSNAWIDTYSPNSMGTVAFIESGYGNVAVQATGTYGQKTFCFSYALAELVDDNPPSTRDTLIQQILDFYEIIVPVELTSFTATSNGSEVILNWSTATELNNQGFEIQRSTEGEDFFTVGFVNGHGTTTEQQNYSYSDRNLDNGNYYYRLKQVDYDGSYEYSDVVEVNFNVPLEYSLQQNYPNPFNPTTTIKFALPERSFVELKVYDILGREVTSLINEEQDAGYYEMNFNASKLSSGVYLYQLKAGEFISTKKMILLR